MSSNSFDLLKKIGFAIGLCVWVVAGFLLVQYGVVFGWLFLIEKGILPPYDESSAMMQLIVLAVSYVIALLTITFLPRLVQIDKTKNFANQLGIYKKPRAIELLLSVPGYVVYFLLTALFTIIIMGIYPGFNSEQTQEVGFTALNLPVEYVIAFVALVIIPPLAEEMLFRGYLFGHLRKRMGFFYTSFIVSALFGLVHLQWNVAADVFALSLVLCYLREKTGHIWASVVLHMIKNGVAFTFLFLVT